VSGFADFWAGRDLWREPMIAGVLAGAVLGYIGVFVVLKRMVFVSAALSEISGVGVAFAFYLGAMMGIDPHAHSAIPVLLEPTWFSRLCACVAAALFSLRPGHRRLAPETIVGLGYIIASALVLAILNSPRIAQEAHAESLPFYEWHRIVEGPAGIPSRQEWNDVRMPQLRCERDLSTEAFRQKHARHFRRQNFQHDFPAERDFVCHKHAGHSTGAELALDCVRVTE